MKGIILYNGYNPIPCVYIVQGHLRTPIDNPLLWASKQLSKEYRRIDETMYDSLQVEIRRC